MKSSWGRFFKAKKKDNFYVYTEIKRKENEKEKEKQLEDLKVLSPIVDLSEKKGGKEFVKDHPQTNCVWKSFLLLEGM